MALDRFLLYRNESLSEIIVSYNKDVGKVSRFFLVTLNRFGTEEQNHR